MSDELFYQNTDLVLKIVNRMNYPHQDREDLIQAGMMGLYQATKNFKENKNASFTTYASYYIIGEIKKEIRNNRMIKLSREMYKILRKLKQKTDLYSIDTLSKELDVSKENILLALSYKEKLVSLNQEDFDLVAIVEDKSSRFNFEILHNLDNMSQEIIYLKYYKGYTQREIGKKLNLSQSKISRLEKMALITLRNSQ